MASIFGDLFDFNGDGNLDSFEKAAEFSAFANMMDEEEQDDEEDEEEDDEEEDDEEDFY